MADLREFWRDAAADRLDELTGEAAERQDAHAVYRNEWELTKAQVAALERIAANADHIAASLLTLVLMTKNDRDRVAAALRSTAQSMVDELWRPEKRYGHIDDRVDARGRLASPELRESLERSSRQMDEADGQLAAWAAAHPEVAIPTTPSWEQTTGEAQG